MQVFNIVYILLNGFWCYILYLFISAFFDSLKVGQMTQFLTYVGYHICSLTVYFVIGNALVFSLFNLITCFALTFMYSSTLIKKICVALIIFTTVTITEITVAMVCGYFKITTLENFTIEMLYQSILIQLVISRLVLFTVALAIRNFKSIKKGIKISLYNWAAIVILPAFSLYIGLLIFNAHWINKTTLMVGVAGILLINFSIFYLYDAIIKAQTEKIAQALLLEQNKSYEKQFATIRESALISNTIKHDFKHHLAVILGMIQNGMQDDCIDYISTLTETKNSLNNIVDSGNIIIDSILNFKLEKAIKNNVTIHANVCIPNDLLVSSVDMTIILGNLVDNAIEATQKVNNGIIDITIKETKGRFIIKISNTYDGVVKVKEKSLLTTKEDETNHGLGMESVGKVISKYDGELTFDFTENTFNTVVLLYI